MKRCLMLCALLAICGAPAHAGSFGLFAGGITTADADSSVGVGFAFEWDMAEKTDFLLRFAVYTDLTTDPNPEVYKIESVPIDIGVNWDFGKGDSLTPYFGVGLTYYVFDFSFADTTTSAGPPRGVDIDPEIGYFAQLGVSGSFDDNWSWFAEVVGRVVETEVEGDDLGLPIDQEVDMNGGSVHIGVALSW